MADAAFNARASTKATVKTGLDGIKFDHPNGAYTYAQAQKLIHNV